MIGEVSINDSHQLAKLHTQALPGDFLPSLGVDFLEAFYGGVIGRRSVFGFASRKKGCVEGFVIGTENMGDFIKLTLINNFLKLSFLLFVQVLKRPLILKNLVETLTYSGKENKPPAELVVIAIDKSSRRKGLGRKLILELESEMKRRGIGEYKLAVTKRNKKANAFYQALNFDYKSSFRLYGKSWNVLVKKL